MICIGAYANKRSIRTCFSILVTLWVIIIVIFFLTGYVFRSYWLTLQSINGTIGIFIYVSISISHYRLNSEVRRMERNANSSHSDVNLIQKVFKLSTSVLAVLGLCYFPFILYAIVRLIVGDLPVFIYLRPWCFFATLMNPMLDPILYCVRLESIRQKVRNLFLCKSRGVTSSSGASD